MASANQPDAYSRDDLAAALQAILDTNEALAAAFPSDPGVQSYRVGFAQAVQAMATAIGVSGTVQTAAQRQSRRMDQWVGAWEVAP